MGGEVGFARTGKDVVMPITVGDGTWVGARTVIMPGVTIGEGCIIGSNSVITKDCEPNGFYAGAPARLIRKLPVDPDIPAGVGRGDQPIPDWAQEWYATGRFTDEG